MGVVRIGAQRASLRQRLTAVLAGTFFATVFGFAVGAANPAPAAAYTPPYYTVETYYLKLVNCTRTAAGSSETGRARATAPGGTPRMSRRSSCRPDCRAWRGSGPRSSCSPNACKHGDPSARLRAAGYTSGTWGENIGCGNGHLERPPRGAAQPPPIPGREVDRRRALEEHQERAVQVHRHRCLEGLRPGAPGDRLLQLVVVRGARGVTSDDFEPIQSPAGNRSSRTS